ncbi:MAG: ankyrin repeat domain-containing protein [Armatimonadetes bacterium]|nr:ankyrin repeat domain-containing protein [Armatimonadota bacterium]
MIDGTRNQRVIVAGLIAGVLLAGCSQPNITKSVLEGDVRAVERILKKHPGQANQKDAGGNTILHAAIRTGDEEMVRAILLAGGDPNTPNSQGDSPLEDAICRGSVDVAQTLIAFGAKKDDPGRLLRRAAWAGHIPAAEFMLKEGANVNDRAKSESGGNSTALHAAVVANRPDMVDFLVRNGADPNFADGAGHTPLHLAAESVYTQMTKTLLAGGAKVGMRSKTGETALHRAAAYGRTKTVEALIAGGADPNAAADDGYTPYDSAAMARAAETIKTLKSLGARPSNRWALVDAVMLEDTAAAAKIIAQRPSAATELINGQTALHFAARHGCTASARLLIEHGTPVDIRGGEGETPLHTAVVRAKTEMVKLLLDRGADVNAKDRNGQTPLAYLYKFQSPVRLPQGGPVPLKPELKPIEKLLIEHGGKL